MTLQEVIKVFGSGYNLSKCLGIRAQNFTRWKKQGYIPEKQQWRIEKLTNGQLKADIRE